MASIVVLKMTDGVRLKNNAISINCFCCCLVGVQLTQSEKYATDVINVRYILLASSSFPLLHPFSV